MITRKTKYVIPGSNSLHIPTRHDFHRYYSGEIHSSDFCTSYHSDSQTINKIVSSIRFTLKLHEQYENNKKEKIHNGTL